MDSGHDRTYVTAKLWMFNAGIVLSHMLIAAEEHWIDLDYQKLDSIMEKAIQNHLYAGSLILGGVEIPQKF